MKQSTYINNFVDHSTTSGTLQTQIDTHEADTTSIHGIADTSDLALYSVLASVVDSSEGSTLIGYKDDETIKEILDDIINSGVLDTITLSDDGGLNVSWSIGEVYDQTNGNIIITISGSDTCTDNNVNYLKWVSGTSLTLSTTRPDIGTGEVGVGHFHAVDGDIIGGGGHTEDILSKRETTMSDALSQMFPTIVTTGLLISEHTGDGTWDVDSTAGIYFHNGHTRYDVSTIDSTVTPIVRHFHSGGVWATDTNSQIDPTQYDNGTNLAAVTANQHYRSLFIIDPDDVIHWIYPQTNYGTVAAAIEGADPTIPGGLEGFPKSVAVILRGNATAFPLAASDQWIDVRPTLTTAQAASISDHGNLTGLSDNDHPQYLLEVDFTTYSGTLQTQIDLNTTHRDSDGSDHTFIDQTVISGSSPTFGGTNITGIPGTNVTVLNTSETLDEILEDIIPDGILNLITVTDVGGLNVQWTAGEIYVDGNIIDTVSGSATLTDDATNYIYGTVAGDSTLQVATSLPENSRALAATIWTHNDDIHQLIQEAIISDRSELMIQHINDTHNQLVHDGLNVTVDTDGTNANDFIVAAGNYYVKPLEKITISGALYSAGGGHGANNLHRYFHTASVWDAEYSNGVDFAYWDNGTQKTATSAGKWYCGFIFIERDDHVDYIYPQVEYSLESQAAGATIVYPPDHDEFSVILARFIFKSGASSFGNNAYFIDARPIHGSSVVAGAIQTLWKTINADTGSTTAAASDAILTIAGAGTITTSITDDTVTISGELSDQIIYDTDFTSSGIMRRLDASGSYDVIDPDHLYVTTSGDVGVHTKTPVEALGVNGAINLGTTTKTNVGTIRYTGSDFEGYRSSSWLSLTKPTLSKSISVEYPTDSENISMFFTPVAITVTEMRAVVSGTLPSVTWSIRHHATDRSIIGNEVVTGGTTTTSTTSGSDVTAFDDATITTDSFVWFETTTQSGTVDELHVTLIYTED